MYHPSTLNDPPMRYFLGRVVGWVVTGSIAYIGDDIVGIYGVSTLPEYGGRDYGKAATWAAALFAPRARCCGTAVPDGVGMESELGFSPNPPKDGV